MLHSDIDEVVGFDLGHGETSVARMTLEPGAAPQIIPVFGKRSQITAVAHRPDVGVLVGELALRSATVTDKQVAFKQKPPGTPESRKALLDFVRRYHAILTSRDRIAAGNRTHYFVGCPSAWSAAEMNDYQTLLQGALPKVTVVRESRAALVQAKEDTGLTIDQLRSSILVLDFGSSTIDVSYILGGIHDHTLDTGMQLGGSLIDKEILRRSVARSGDRSAIEALFTGEDGEVIGSMCEVHCREAKERFCELEEGHRRRCHRDFDAGRQRRTGDRGDALPQRDGIDPDHATSGARRRDVAGISGSVSGGGSIALAIRGVAPL